MSTELLGFLIKAGAILLFIVCCIVSLNWARRPGRRRQRKPDPDSVEGLQKSLVTMDRILVAMGIFLVLFVIAMIILFVLFQSTPDALIVAVFGICGFECGAMAAIQRRKTEVRERLRAKQEITSDKEGLP